MMLSNEPFLVAHVAAWTIKARALPMASALTWSEQANAIKARIDGATDYADMADLISNALAFVREYPALQLGANPTAEIPEKAWQGFTPNQVIAALEVLLEANDPFVSVRRRRQEQEDRGYKLLMAMPADERNKILQAQLSQLQNASVSTHAELSNAGPGDNGTE